MSYPYRVELTIGTHSWTVHRGDAPVLPVVLAPLVTGWQMPDTDLWPTQPEPVTTSLSILAYGAADLADINMGTTYHLRVFTGAVNAAGAESPSVRSAGRVSELGGAAFRFRDPATGLMKDGWKLDLHLSDYTADPAEITVYADRIDMHGQAAGLGSYYWPRDRLLLLTLPGDTTGNVLEPGQASITSDRQSATQPPQGDTVLGPIDYGDYLSGGTSEPLILSLSEASDTSAANRIYGPATLAETFDRYLSIWPNAGASVGGVPALYSAQGWRRAIYRAKLDPVTGLQLAAQPWRLEWVSRRNLSSTTLTTLPLKFAAHGGLYGPVKAAPDPAKAKDGSLLLSASVVDVDATWSRTKQTEPNRVVVTTGVQDQALVTWRTVTRSDARGGDAVVSATLDNCPLVDPTAVGALADMYNGDDEQTPATQWALGTVTWYASRDPAGARNVSLFPDAELWRGHSTPVVIEGIPSQQKPLTAPYVGGAPKSVQFTIAGGEFTYDLGLYPRIPRPAANGAALTFADLAAAFPAVKVNQLDDATSITYRLVHTTTID